ncbi:MAG TPA: PAS domain S-box protein [Candidatus Limnocylindrales bacterium]|nr:PAS domain S-box protein [Candidatus Limnocylindrales bacterium]
MKKQKTQQEIVRENEDLRGRLEEAEETLRAIRHGEVDALVVKGKEGPRIYTLKGADHTYRVLIESMNEGAVTFDSSGIILYANQGFSDMIGIPLKKVIGSMIISYIAIEDLKVFKKLLSESRVGSRHEKEIQIVKKGTGNFPSLLSVAPIDLENDKPGMSMITTDLSGQKQHEQLIAEEKLSEQRLKHEKALRREIENEQNKLTELFMQAPALIAILKEPQHIFELANPLYMQLVGMRDIVGKPIREALPELKGQGIYELLDSVYKTGKPYFGNEVLVKLDRKGDGKLEDSYFNFVYQASRNSKNKIDGILIYAIEVTEQVKARQLVEESEEKFRTLAENIPNLVWTANADGWIYWYNSRWYKYTGTKPAQMEGWGWKSVHHPDALPHVLKKWKESITTGEPFEMVFPIKGKDKKFRPFLTRVIPVKDKKGKIIKWFGTNTDISKQKELERQKDDFLGIASHELKTPVTSIKAYGQVLQTIFTRKGDQKAVEQLQKMDAQINKLTNLIGDLLDVTKIQSGRLEFHEDYFDFNGLVGEVIDDLQLTTEKHKIKQELGKVKKVYADRERIGQVITNLISNAIKYSPHTKKIIVRTKKEKNKVTLSVEDFGVGIPKAKQDKVFKQFFRVSGPKLSTFPGLGLGLYVSSEIIKREGGQIWVESQVGKGSTFYFNLPIDKQKIKQQQNSLVQNEIQHE